MTWGGPSFKVYVCLNQAMMLLDDYDEPLADMVRDIMGDVWVKLTNEERQRLDAVMWTKITTKTVYDNKERLKMNAKWTVEVSKVENGYVVDCGDGSMANDMTLVFTDLGQVKAILDSANAGTESWQLDDE